MSNNTTSNEELKNLLLQLLQQNKLIIKDTSETNIRSVEIYNDVKDIKKDVKDLKESIGVMLDDFKNFKNETRDIEEKIVLMVSKLKPVENSVDREELETYTDLCRSKYENWDDYDDLTRKFLPVSEILYSQLQKFNDPDYSPVILEMCRGFENELKLKIFIEFVKQYAVAHKDDLKEHLKNDNSSTYYNVFTHQNEAVSLLTSTFQKKISSCINSMKKQDNKPIVFTLGEMNFVLEKVGNKPIRDKSQLLTDFYIYLEGITNITDFLSIEYQRKISELVEDFRNKAAHPNFIKKEIMEDCRSKFPEEIDYLMDCLK